MNIEQTSNVLGKIAFFDSRPVTKETIAAWHEILAPHDAQLALDAVAHHYADSSKWIMPAHIVAYVKAHDPATWDRATIDKILGGPDYWSPPTPPEGQSMSEWRAWCDAAHAQHLEERRAQAAEVRLGR